MFELCCSSISGGNFISQIAVLTLILEIRDKSKKIKNKHLDLYLGASGGSLSNTLISFFDETRQSVERILYTLNSKMFVQNWWKGYGEVVNSKLTSIFKDSIYQSGSGAVENFKNLVSDSHFKDKKIPENWFLTFNNDTNSPVIHSTFSEEDSKFKNFEGVETNFLDRDLEKIINTVMASASIPGLKDSVKINQENHVDGGVANPTPYSYFSESIYQKNRNGELSGPCHYYYILPHSLEIVKEDNSMWITDVFSGIKKMIVCNIIKDVEYCFESWLRIINKGKRDLEIIKLETIGKLKLLETLEENHQYDYFVKFYTDQNSIDIVNFSNKELEESFNKCYNSVFIEIFINKNGID